MWRPISRPISRCGSSFSSITRRPFLTRRYSDLPHNPSDSAKPTPVQPTPSGTSVHTGAQFNAVPLPSSNHGLAQEAVMPQATLTKSEVRRALFKSSRFSRLCVLLTAVAGGLAITSQILDDTTPESQLDIAINLLRSSDPRLRLEGFEVLSNSNFISKRVFSGPVKIPYSSQHLANKELIDALLLNARDMNPQISASALTWLKKLMTNKTISSDVEKLLLQADPTMSSLLDALQLRAGGADPNFQSVAAVFISMSDASGSPVSVTYAVRLADRLSGDSFAKLPSEVGALINRSRDQVSPMEFEDYEIGDQESRRVERSILTNLAVSAFATIWGRSIWPVAARLNSEMRDLISSGGERAQKAIKYRKSLLSTRAVGRSVFMLLFTDLAFSVALSQSDAPPFSDLSLNSIPAPSVIASAEIATFSLMAMYFLKTQRFIVAPLVLAGAMNHCDMIPKEYLPRKFMSLTEPNPNFIRPIEATVKELKKSLTSI